MNNPYLTAHAWLKLLEEPDTRLRRSLSAVYGSEKVLQGRLPLLRDAARLYLTRFGDSPLRLFRAPGRINLRGMHVDTHGGYLNLMTHQREVVIAAGTADSASVFVNTDPSFEEVVFDAVELGEVPGPSGSWLRFITSPAVCSKVKASHGHWSNYLKGAVLRARYHCQNTRSVNFQAAIASDLPRGASLSSSAALCTAMTLAALGVVDAQLSPEELIQAARDAEWYTGSRCGLSDQAAIVLGEPGRLVNLTIQQGSVDTRGIRRAPFPSDLTMLVVNSFTERSLSGSARVEYTRNRFAYSLAMDILRQEALSQGCPSDVADAMANLSGLSPDNMQSVGGTRFLLRLLHSIPETISVAELHTRYDLPGLDQVYDRYFGALPEVDHPTHFALRGPLLFGIAESERARRFIDLLEQRDYALAGRLMTIGHDGDRHIRPDGAAYSPDVSDEALDAAARDNMPIEMLPGAYGASSPVLDRLVDTALDAGALGASLTGAGIAGTVLAMCRAEDAGHVADALRNHLGSSEYARLASSTVPLSKEQIVQSVVANHATAAAGEIVI